MVAAFSDTLKKSESASSLNRSMSLRAVRKVAIFVNEAISLMSVG